ncbi:ArdC family protein [Myxococcota bacterium]
MTKQAKRTKRHRNNASQGGSAARGVDTYQLITDRIIEQLENGCIPWRKPWCGGLLPQNLASGHEYRGVNVFILGCCAPFRSPYWVTFRQARELGGSVRKGERGYPIVFYRFLEKERADGTKERFPIVRRWTVFNAEAQCEGIEVPELCEQDSTWDPIEAAEEIVAGFAGGPTIEHNGFQASYTPATDTVHMPRKECFSSGSDYFSTLFHELGHASGSVDRLAREGVTNTVLFSSHAYAKEELVAEMCSSFLCGEVGIIQSTLENSAAYVANWLAKWPARHLDSNQQLSVM